MDDEIVIIGTKMYIHGEELPKAPTKKNGSNVIVRKNGKSYVNGYEFVNGKWKRTWPAFWNCLF